jgi:hypothetical protein
MGEEKFEDIGEIKPEEPQVPEVDLKPLPKGLKYEFLGPDKSYPVIVSDELSPEENGKLQILLKKHRKCWWKSGPKVDTDTTAPLSALPLLRRGYGRRPPSEMGGMPYRFCYLR